MKRFIEGEDRSQAALLPPSLDDYVAEDNPVRRRLRVETVCKRDDGMSLSAAEELGLMRASKCARATPGSLGSAKWFRAV
jgi:hypothetical protein